MPPLLSAWPSRAERARPLVEGYQPPPREPRWRVGSAGFAAALVAGSAVVAAVTLGPAPERSPSPPVDGPQIVAAPAAGPERAVVPPAGALPSPQRASAPQPEPPLRPAAVPPTEPASSDADPAVASGRLAALPVRTVDRPEVTLEPPPLRSAPRRPEAVEATLAGLGPGVSPLADAGPGGPALRDASAPPPLPLGRVASAAASAITIRPVPAAALAARAADEAPLLEVARAEARGPEAASPARVAPDADPPIVLPVAATPHAAIPVVAPPQLPAARRPPPLPEARPGAVLAAYPPTDSEASPQGRERPAASAKPAPAVGGAPPRLVAQVQRALRQQGLDPGPVDGLEGPRTRAAIRLYQRRAGLPADGRVDLALLRRLGVPEPTPPRGGAATDKSFARGLADAVTGMLGGVGRALGGLFEGQTGQGAGSATPGSGRGHPLGGPDPGSSR